MNTVPRVVEAADLGGYRLRLTFDDGRIGEVDLHDTIFNDHRDIVLALRDPAQFRQFHLEFHTVVWNNGFDVAPEYLYGMLDSDQPDSSIRSRKSPSQQTS